MKQDYKLVGKLDKIEVTVEHAVAEAIREMEKHSKLSASELANTALKNFIERHSDFLPKQYWQKINYQVSQSQE